MYVCRTVWSETNPNGLSTVLEVNAKVLDGLINLIAELNSRASQDAMFMALANGTEVRSPLIPGVTYVRVNTPMFYTPKPVKCDVTGKPLANEMYDGRTVHGSWAIMGTRAWNKVGCGRLGTGFAQKYLRNEAGDFYASEGMESVPRSYRLVS